MSVLVFADIKSVSHEEFSSKNISYVLEQNNRCRHIDSVKAADWISVYPKAIIKSISSEKPNGKGPAFNFTGINDTETVRFFFFETLEDCLVIGHL